MSAATERIADRNLAAAVAIGRQKASRGPGSGAVEAFMTEVAYTPRNEAVIEAEAEIEAAERRDTAVVVAGFVVGETGGSSHRARAEAIRLLRVLGIIPDPESKPARRHGGNGGR